MSPIDISKPVKLKDPLQGEEDLIYKITNFNDVTQRCYIELVSSLPGINPGIAPQELISIEELENIG